MPIYNLQSKTKVCKEQAVIQVLVYLTSSFDSVKIMVI